MYHASIKSANNHNKEIHKKEKENKRKAEKIIANRKRELLCVMKDSVSGAEYAEWLNDEDVLCDNPVINTSNEDTMPVINSLSDWLTSPWTKET